MFCRMSSCFSNAAVHIRRIELVRISGSLLISACSRIRLLTLSSFRKEPIVDSSGQAIRHYYTFAMEHPITKEIAVSNSIESTFSNALRSYIRFYQFGWDDVSVDPSVTYVDYMPLGTLIKFWIIPSES